MRICCVLIGIFLLVLLCFCVVKVKKIEINTSCSMQ